MSKNVMFKGISGTIRRGIHSGQLKGLITPDDVRELLPEEKKAAPDKVIEKSMYHLANNNEIKKVHQSYFTNEAEPEKKAVEVIVVGCLISAETVNGKMIAKVEVSSLEYK